MHYIGNQVLGVDKNDRAQVHTSNLSMQDAGNCARIVPPSEWVKIDVILLPFFCEVFEHDGSSRKKFLDLDESRVVQRREEFIGCDWLIFMGKSCQHLSTHKFVFHVTENISLHSTEFGLLLYGKLLRRSEMVSLMELLEQNGLCQLRRGLPMDLLGVDSRRRSICFTVFFVSPSSLSMWKTWTWIFLLGFLHMVPEKSRVCRSTTHKIRESAEVWEETRSWNLCILGTL